MRRFVSCGAAVLALTAASSTTAQVTGALGGGKGNFLTLSSSGLSDGTSPVAALLGGMVDSQDKFTASLPDGNIYGGTFLAAGPSSMGAATLSFLRPVNYLSFLWGSPDTYNRLTINSTGGGSQVFTATGLGFASTDGNQSVSQYVQFTTDQNTLIQSITFDNRPSIDAFESANFSIAAVPEPATWAMMIVGFGALGYAMRRRTAKVRTGMSVA